MSGTSGMSGMSGKFHYFVICLTSNVQRMDNVKHLNTLIPSLNIVDAIVPDEDLLEKLKKQEFFYLRNNAYIDSFNRPYRKASVGNFLSHKQLLKHIAMSCTSEFAVVFEDDVSIKDDFEGLLHQQVLPRLQDLIFDVAHLHVMDFQKYKHTSSDESIESISFVRSPPGFCGTQCYVVRPHRLNNVLQCLKNFRDPIDEQLTRDPSLKVVHLVGLDMIDEIHDIPSTASHDHKFVCKDKDKHIKVSLSDALNLISTLGKIQPPYLPKEHPFVSKIEENQSYIVVGQNMVDNLQPTTKLFVVDTFLPSANQLISQRNINMSLPEFRNLIHDKPNVIPVPLTSIEAVELFGHYKHTVHGIYLSRTQDVIYHQTKLDIIFYWNLLENGGYFMGSDFDNPEVFKAVEEFATDRHLILETFPGWLVWSLRKPLVSITDVDEI